MKKAVWGITKIITAYNGGKTILKTPVFDGVLYLDNDRAHDDCDVYQRNRIADTTKYIVEIVGTTIIE